MGFILFIRWWYGAGWINSFYAIQQRVNTVAQELSMGILLRTLFEPWKQITLYAGESAALDTKIHVLLDNLFARFFGFIIRSAVLAIGLIVLILTFVLGVVLALMWPIIPVLPIVFMVLAGIT